MNCDRVQRALDALADGELNWWTARRVNGHFNRCPACAAAWSQTQRVGERMRSWRDVAAPAALRPRIAAGLPGDPAARRHGWAPGWTKRRKWASLTAAGLGAAVLAGAALLVHLNTDTAVGDRRDPAAHGFPAPGSSEARLFQEREPGGQVLDDLLYLNPVRLAAADETGLQAASSVLTAEAPGADERLQQKVVVHATMQKLADVLAGLSRATGVTLLPRMEVAAEKVSLWAEDRPLIDVMRDLRHLHGYFWSRAKRDGQYVYSIWQDAQSRAREEAELRRLAMEQQRQFEENIRRHVRALNATDEELKRLAQEDPYLVAQMKHPVVRGGYQLFATLSPDQQAQLTRGQTPSRGKSAGDVMNLFPLEHREGDPFFDPPEYVAQWEPIGDVVTLRPGEMTPAQRAVVAALIKGAAIMTERHANTDPKGPDEGERWRIRSAAAASPETATVTLFRWGDPNWQGLSLRVDFTSEARKWGIYSNIGVPPSVQKSYSDDLRAGRFGVWPGAQEEIDRYLGRDREHREKPSAAPEREPATRETPDPILDAPVTLTWRLPLRDPHSPMGSGYRFTSGEVLAALARDLQHPLVLDTMPAGLEPPRGGGPEFRVEKRPLREVLQRLFPGREIHTDDGAIFIRDPERLRSRINAAPDAVNAFLIGKKGSITLDDMVFLARSLSPWQIVKLTDLLPPATIDQLLAAQELLKLYGELSPAQRSALPRGLAISALTPAQQALFLALAERCRPFVEPWRFQAGALRLTAQPAPRTNDGRGGGSRPVSRRLFEVRFQDGDTQSFPVDMFPPMERSTWKASPREWVGRPFPFPSAADQPLGRIQEGAAWKPALGDPRLRNKTSVIVITRPFAEPYAGLRPPPAPDTWARGLAEHLRSTGIPIFHVTIGAPESKPTPLGDRSPARQAAVSLPNLIPLAEPGDLNGEAFDSAGSGWVADRSPTVFILSEDEIVRAVFEDQDAWDTTAIERAARALAAKRVISSRR